MTVKILFDVSDNSSAQASNNNVQVVVTDAFSRDVLKLLSSSIIFAFTHLISSLNISKKNCRIRLRFPSKMRELDDCVVLDYLAKFSTVMSVQHLTLTFRFLDCLPFQEPCVRIFDLL